ncbi:HAD-like domain-containing protein [Boletus coccyginus]|nr:HAD-like domain-containing protein [Boletus coccyginus]
MPEVKFQVGAVLFDMDGTLIDSTTGVIGAWEAFAKTYPGLDVKTILRSSHGVRTKDNLAKWCGITDPELLKGEAGRFERAIIESAEDGIKMLPGVRSILDRLSPAKDKPNQRWTICTSATRVYATAALNAANIDYPDDFVTADDVHKGKPHPEPYLEGAARCGVGATDCVVVEDAPVGVASGLAAGSRVIGLLTTHSREQMLKATESAPQGYFYLVQDLSSVSMVLANSGHSVEIAITLV